MGQNKRRLFENEPPLTGISRILRTELALIDQVVGAAHSSPLTEEQVHYVRKLSKASRAHWRLLQEAVSDQTFESFEDRIADTARHFASLREHAVLSDTFGNLLEHTELDAAIAANVRLILSLSTPKPQAHSPSALSRVLPRLDVPSKGQRKLMMRALRRGYRRGRSAMKRAMRELNDAERLHEFRKHVKYHNNQLATLRPSSKLRKRREQLDELAELLGAHHDLAELKAFLESAVPHHLQHADMLVVDEQIRKRHSMLVERALALGRSLYARRVRAAGRWLVKQSSSLR